MANASLRGTSNLIGLMPKRLSSHAAAAQGKKKESSAPRGIIPHEPIQVTKSKNGIVVASLENYSPVSRLAAVFKVGSRDEQYAELGAIHALRRYANLKTANFSSYALTRRLDQHGVNFSVIADRENIVYVVEAARNNIEKGFEALAEITSRPLFWFWEVADAQPKLELDLDLYKNSPEKRIIELLHKAAYKSQLSNSLYAPKFNVGNLNSETLVHFRERNFTSDRLTLVGTGLDHTDINRWSDDFRLPAANAKGAREKVKYLGNEVRKANTSDLVHVAVASEGASLSGSDLLASSLLNHAFGLGSRIKYSSGTNRISKAGLAGATHNALVASFNLNYTDSGLFGFRVLADKSDVEKIVRNVFKEMAKVGKNGITSEELATAKTSLKNHLAEHLEDPVNLISAIAAHPTSANEYANHQSISKAIDAVSNEAVNAFAKKVSSGKPSMAAIGNLSQLSLLDELRTN